MNIGHNIKMVPYIKRDWTQRLRDDRSMQTQGALTRLFPLSENPIGSCCLGLLTAQACSTLELPVKVLINGEVAYGSKHASGLPPIEVVTWAFGLSSDYFDSTGWHGEYSDPDRWHFEDVWQRHFPFVFASDTTLPFAQAVRNAQNREIGLATENDGGMPFKHLADLIDYLY